MASSVFYKFKSQKEENRITFDGTGISVFELKREIINLNSLGDAKDFDLHIYEADTQKEYEDDTEVISRSSHITARRLPASRPGHGNAIRYVSGKMPVKPKNFHRLETNKTNTTSATSAIPGQGAQGGDEEDKEAAFLQQTMQSWQEDKAKMANAAPVHHGKFQKPVNVPDHPPPPGYTCHRCGVRGHWIQACPTNSNAEFDNKPRIKRTTGIPRSFLQVVKEPKDGSTDPDGRQRSGVMVNAEGQQVIAKTDDATWQKFQAKAQAANAQQQASEAGSKELRDRGLECPIDNRMFLQPMKTPCCGKTYCNDCIENALISSDFVCPNCEKDGILIDDLILDDDMDHRIKEYEEEKKAEKAAKAVSKSPSPAPGDKEDAAKTGDTAVKALSKSPTPSKSTVATPATESANPESVNGSETGSKKRKADDLPISPPKAPKAMRQQQNQANGQNDPMAFFKQIEQQMNQQMKGFPNGNMPNNQYSGAPNFPMAAGMGYPNPYMNGGMGMGMSMPTSMPGGAMMGMPNMNGMVNPMMMPNGQWGGNQGYGNIANGYGSGYPNGNMYNQNQGYGSNQGYGNQGYSGYGGQNQWQQQQHGGNQQWGMNGNMNGMNGGGVPNQQQQNIPNGSTAQQFPNQQRTTFSEPLGGEDDAYFRKPVNPHRHQNRQRRVRPSDYTEL